MSALKIGFCPALTQEVFFRLENKGLTKVQEFLKYDAEEVTKITDVPYKVKSTLFTTTSISPGSLSQVQEKGLKRHFKSIQSLHNCIADVFVF